MNERLKELYRQAHSTRHYDGDPALDGNPPTVYWQDETSAQRFAELIVRECMSINTQRLFSDYEGDTHRVAHNNALWCAWGDMQEYFGVE